MHRMPHRWLKIVIVLAMVLLGLGGLSACSSSNSTQAIAPPTATAGVIEITLDRTRYDSHTPIGVTVTNTSNNTYYALTGRSACTYLQLQAYDTAKHSWTSVFGCTGANPTSLQIAPKLSEPFTLSPNSANDPNAWEPGMYRVVLAYGSVPDASSASNMAYSAGFQIAAG